MSIMCCVYVPEGIVMAADSRLTRTTETNNVEIPAAENVSEKTIVMQTTYTSSDNAQKVLLIRKTGTGVSFCGDAMIDGVTVADFVRKFEIERVAKDDTTEEIAHKLSDYYAGSGTHFFVCGYNSDVPFVFDVFNKSVKRENIDIHSRGEESTKDAADDCTPTDTEIPKNVAEEQSKPVIPSELPTVIPGAIWAGQKTAITKIVNEKPALNASWGTMPLKDAIDFAEFLVDTTIKYERFCDDIQTCGGDVDILVITKDDAFWKQHKIYNPKV
ncbi:MAG: hypothetical protein RR313_12795 [Anaerovoracaceae bacterium]